jgi:hypothetical protein
MSRLTIAPSNTHFLRDGRPLCYVADTAWMAFSDARLDDWEEYLAFRKAQGFNAVQISMMPITHDTSEAPSTAYPFAVRRDGSFDFNVPNEEYFERAVTMVRMAAACGLIPAIAPLWVNWIPGTWASAKSPRTAIPFEAAERHLDATLPLFAPFRPVFLASGDTRFEGEESLYYRMVLRQIRSHCPGSLTTLHRSPGADLPDELCRSADLDFYMYQSGHHLETQDLAWKLAQEFRAKPVRRPIVNGEPCYDGCGHGFRYGRFGRFEVRRAIWQSLLAGANAGFAYGAHGVWCWHRRGSHFTSVAFSGQPFDWRTALHLGGAADATFAGSLVEQHGIFDMEPTPLVLNETPEIRMAATADRQRFAAYVPYPVTVELGLDLAGYSVRMIDLETRTIGHASIEPGAHGSSIAIHTANADVLVVGERD